MSKKITPINEKIELELNQKVVMSKLKIGGKLVPFYKVSIIAEVGQLLKIEVLVPGNKVGLKGLFTGVLMEEENGNNNS